MRVLVCGSRHSEQKDFIWERLDKFHAKTPITVLIEGGQRKFRGQGKTRRHVGGVDYWAYMWGHKNMLKVITERADWTRFGKGAGPIRNLSMIVKHTPELVIAFPGGSGTANMVRQAREHKISVQKIA